MREINIECPVCREAGAHKMPAMADISADAALKNKLLDGSFFEWTCPGCSRRFFVDDVFLCCNKERGYCIYLVPGYEGDTLPIPTLYKSKCTGTLRVTSAYVDFAEKLRIFEAGLNDRIIEAMKAVYSTVCQQAGQGTIYHMTFEHVHPDGRLGFAVLLENDDATVDLPAQAYEHALADFDALLPEGSGEVFIKVDQEWLGRTLGDGECE